MEDEDRIRERDGIVIIRIAGEVRRKNRGRSARNAKGNRCILCSETVIEIEITAHCGCTSIKEDSTVHSAFGIRKRHKERERPRETCCICRDGKQALNCRLTHCRTSENGHRTERLCNNGALERKIFGIWKCTVEEFHHDALESPDILVVLCGDRECCRKSGRDKLHTTRRHGTQREDRKLILK